MQPYNFQLTKIFNALIIHNKYFTNRRKEHSKGWDRHKMNKKYQKF